MTEDKIREEYRKCVESFDYFKDKYAEKWSIKDAKKGDILFLKEKNLIFIFRERNYEKINYYALLNKFGVLVLSWFIQEGVDTIIPATQEQSNLILNTISNCKDTAFVLDLIKKKY